MKNAFLNLAVPCLQLTEPGAALVTKIHDKLKVTLWDRWDIKLGKDISIKKLFEYLEKTYEIKPNNVMFG